MITDFIEEVIIWIIGALTVAVIAAAVIVPIWTLVNHSEHVSCLRLEEQSGYPTKTVGVMTPDCYVLFEERWIPEKNFIVNAGN